MIVLVDDTGDVFVAVDGGDVEAACRAEFWRREVEYQAPPNTEGNPAYRWAGIDWLQDHWTIWCDEDGDVYRTEWLRGRIVTVTPWR